MFKDKAIRAVRRDHPSVVGDGQQTIARLIEIENQDPSRTGVNSSRRLIKTTDELHRTLEKYGFDIESVPAVGQRFNFRLASLVDWPLTSLTMFTRTTLNYASKPQCP